METYLKFFNIIICIIAGAIESPTIIISDKWKSYTKIGNDKRYKHLTVNHSKNFVNSISGAHTKTIERTWGSYKEGNKRRRGTHSHFLDSYISEYIWEDLKHPNSTKNTYNTNASTCQYLKLKALLQELQHRSFSLRLSTFRNASLKDIPGSAMFSSIKHYLFPLETPLYWKIDGQLPGLYK
ncbi:hypothetical protein HZS_1871 [Henneguya salminicola]|nr:hypothetical protein HZS_1871 [Henneguya salminicola]